MLPKASGRIDCLEREPISPGNPPAADAEPAATPATRNSRIPSPPPNGAADRAGPQSEGELGDDGDHDRGPELEYRAGVRAREQAMFVFASCCEEVQSNQAIGNVLNGERSEDQPKDTSHDIDARLPQEAREASRSS